MNQDKRDKKREQKTVKVSKRTSIEAYCTRCYQSQRHVLDYEGVDYIYYRCTKCGNQIMHRR